jgi:hypothetical protein
LLDAPEIVGIIKIYIGKYPLSIESGFRHGNFFISLNAHVLDEKNNEHLHDGGMYSILEELVYLCMHAFRWGISA